MIWRREQLFLQEGVIKICKNLVQDSISKPIINQLIRSPTSIGANYMEANGAGSIKDFANKINIVKKECRETKFWIRMAIKTFPLKKNEFISLEVESIELTLIFSKISHSLKLNKT